MPKWLQNAVFYEIYPQSFYDSNGDGIGDLNGIIQKLDYVKSLGCNAVWLNPCYDSPFMDAGYDVRDYKKVAPRYGTNDDLVNLFHKAHEKGIKIILDLVPGHTSDEHEWFQSSKTPGEEAHKNRYIWTDSVWEAPPQYRLMCGITDRDGNYMVNFFSSQPALNYGFREVTHPKWQLPFGHPDCQKTVEALKDIMRFWLDRGCDGFRVDMADSLVKNDEDKTATSKIWREVRDMLDRDYPQAALVSEWSCPQRALSLAGFHSDFYLDHYGNGYNTLFRYTDKETGQDKSFFNKEGNGDITLFTEEYCKNLSDMKGQGYISLITCNHDTPRMSKTLDETARKLAYCTIFTLPGVPFLYYGDEIGMRFIEGLTSKEGGFSRTGTRTPMQWSSGKNLGFSTADASALYLPVDPAEDAPTVEQQEQAEGSMLRTVREIIKLRNENEDLNADGPFEVLYAQKNEYPFIYRRGKFAVAVNPSGKEAAAPAGIAGKVLFQIGSVQLENGKTTLGPQSFVLTELTK